MTLFHLALVLALAPAAFAGDFAALCADRAASERVFYEHRTGTKPPFEETLPRAMLERLVRDELKKEAILARAYDVTITDAMVEAEVARINATTRAPEMLAEIKVALGNDAARFARGMARPVVVERTLRARFENDDKLHAAQRAIAEKARADLLGKKTVEGMHDVTWQFAPRPAGEREPGGRSQESAVSPAPAKATVTSGSYSIEVTTQLAQVLGPPVSGADANHYFDDLAPELQNVLRVQLQKPGDVSAVIETPGAFLVFVAKEKAAAALTASSVTITKRSYDEWLAQQPEP